MKAKKNELVSLLAQECNSMQDIQQLLKDMFKETNYFGEHKELTGDLPYSDHMIPPAMVYVYPYDIYILPS
ncbi:hypothetical protein ACE41H_02555 [Paenibacillus enshidis]|uniref:Uncharacterized protein n=1 Tax=Paenibacillus enshidis TaxID=1458439 RepID=A0ABV5ANB0_9BACL